MGGLLARYSGTRAATEQFKAKKRVYSELLKQRYRNEKRSARKKRGALTPPSKGSPDMQASHGYWTAINTSSRNVVQ
jgi:hypothetical protein